MEDIELYEFTNSEGEWLAELVQEKLQEMGIEAESFSYQIRVTIPKR